MYKRKISQPAYYSKENLMVYNLHVVLFLYLKWFKNCSGLEAKPFYFRSHRITKNIKLLNFKRKLLKMYKSKRSQPAYHLKEKFMLYSFNGRPFFVS